LNDQQLHLLLDWQDNMLLEISTCGNRTVPRSLPLQIVTPQAGELTGQLVPHSVDDEEGAGVLDFRAIRV
jgi:hypothetical protein